MGQVYVNRTLNLRKIQYLGFDMDHTLVRYNSQAFEETSHQVVLQKLVEEAGFPQDILQLEFDYALAIRGLVIDKKKGNILKLSRHAAIRTSQHGLTEISYSEQRKIYGSKYVDLKDPNYHSVDTAFSISTAVLFAQLVDLKDKGVPLPEYEQLGTDLMNMVDKAHRDDTLKRIVRLNLDKYIVRSPRLVESLERYRLHDKKLFVLTNSDFAYTKVLLDYAINPYLKNYRDWSELFTFTITNAKKPRFFYEDTPFLRVNPSDGSMSEMKGKLSGGVYQGGCARRMTEDLELAGDDILYIGDHIYGDILRLKKDCAWRTAMVIEDFHHEVKKNLDAIPTNARIEELMREKEPLEWELVDLSSLKVEKPAAWSESQETRAVELQRRLVDIDKLIVPLIKKQQQIYNASWGELMRAGNEDSYFAHQLERFACIYMEKLDDLLEFSPRSYFRAVRRPQVHELTQAYKEAL